jgi:hypothetical protein
VTGRFNMKNKTDIMPNGKTREMHNAYNSQWCKRNRETMSTLLRAWRGKRMEWLDYLKQGMHCIICGESDYRCLDFHHREPSKKISEIQRLVISTADNSAVMEEISKCDVLCANCHRKKHARDATKMVGKGQDRLRNGEGLGLQ